jgi:hypothetical protein
MATITSVGSGNWATAGTWDAGVPADGDDVVIASGHTVTFNADQSAFTTGVKITITGTLTHTTASGNYCLFAKTGASIVGAGTWNIGTSGTPIPFAAKHTITGAAGWYVDGNAGLTMTVYGAEPSIKYVKLSGDEAIGQTELSVDTDVTGDIWAVGDKVFILSSHVGGELLTIASGGIASTTITFTTGLVGAKNAGSYLMLVSRNVRIIAVGTGNYTVYRVGGGRLTIGEGSFQGISNKGFFNGCGSMTITGGAFYTGKFFSTGCDNASATDGMFANCIVADANSITLTNGFYFDTGLTNYVISSGAIIDGATAYGTEQSISGSNHYVSNSTFSNGVRVVEGNTNSTFVNCTFNSIINCVWGGTGIKFYNCTFYNGAAINSSFAIVDSCTFTGTSVLAFPSVSKFHNCTFAIATEATGYTGQWIARNTQSEDHDGVDGALKAWCKGGVVTSQTSVKPTGYTQAYLLDPESATYPVFFTKQFSVEPSKTVNVVVQLRKDASMTYLPRVYLMASIGNPLAGATPVDTFTMTDSTNTWESDTFTIANSTDYDQDYTLYFVAKNASGNAYAAYDITTAGGSGGGGAVSIQPISGRLSL